MTQKTFKFSKTDLDKKLPTIIQRKLKTVMKCYTIIGFMLDKENKSFTFKVSYKKHNQPVMSYPKEFIGKYELKPIGTDEKNSEIVIMVVN